MGWDQEYHVESYLELLIKLTGKHPEELLEKYLLDGPKPYVTDKEEIVLDDSFYGPIKGTKVTLSDGTVLVPKLVERFNENGNHGIDTYEYHHENETPEVMYIGLDSSDPNVDSYTVPENYGECCDDGGCGCGW